MKKYFSIILVFFCIFSISHGQTANKFDVRAMKPFQGVKRIAPPVFRFLFPQAGDVLQRGRNYTLSWKQIRQSPQDLSTIRLTMVNRATNREFVISDRTANRGFFHFTLPVSAENGDYQFRIMPVNMSFVNQSPDFRIGAFDLVCEIRNMARVYTWKNYLVAGKENFYVEFEIWITNRGSGIFSQVPVVWRVMDKNSGKVLIQREAGFSKVYPNRYYSARIRETFYTRDSAVLIAGSKHYFNDSKALIEVEIDPRNTLGESAEFRQNNLVRREVAYDMHVKGGK